MDSVTVKVDRFSLVALDELLGDQLEVEAGLIAQVFDEPGPYDASKGRVKAKLRIDVDLEFHVERRQVWMAAKVSSRLPARKAVARPLMLRNGELYYESDDTQLDLYETKEEEA